MSDLLNSQIDSEQQKIAALENEKSPEKLRKVLSKKKDLLVTKVDEGQAILTSSMQKLTSPKAKEYLEIAGILGSTLFVTPPRQLPSLL